MYQFYEWQSNNYIYRAVYSVVLSNNPRMWILFSSSFQGWGNQSTERLSHLPWDTQLVTFVLLIEGRKMRTLWYATVCRVFKLKSSLEHFQGKLDFRRLKLSFKLCVFKIIFVQNLYCITYLNLFYPKSIPNFLMKLRMYFVFLLFFHSLKYFF